MRADGYRLRNTDPMYTVAAHIMDKRVDSMNMITVDVPMEPVRKYLSKKRKEGEPLSHLAVFIAAYLRTLSEYPELNRFIVNCKPYARKEIAVAMVVLKAGKTDNGTITKMYFKPENTVFEVNDIIRKYIEDNKNAPENNETEKMIKFLLSIPGLLRYGVKLFKFMDKHGLLPKRIIDMSPFHNSLVVSDLVSIRTNHIYHHCYEFGTTSIFLTMGNLREVPRKKDGVVTTERCMPLGVVMDERICSGSYFSIAFRRMQHFLKNPSVLEQPPKEVKIDPALEKKMLKKAQKQAKKAKKTNT